MEDIKNPPTEIVDELRQRELAGTKKFLEAITDMVSKPNKVRRVQWESEDGTVVLNLITPTNPKDHQPGFRCDLGYYRVDPNRMRELQTQKDVLVKPLTPLDFEDHFEVYQLDKTDKPDTQLRDDVLKAILGN